MIRVVPASRAQVSAYVATHHRHHSPAVGDVFRLAIVDESGAVRGVASVGRPVARVWDDAWTLEVNRVATDGVRNGCSMLYGAARKIAWAMGYRRLVTYTLPEEGGASLRAAGWTCNGDAGGGQWSVPSRPRREAENASIKTRWTCINPAAFGGDVAWPEGEASSAQVGLFGGGS